MPAGGVVAGGVSAGADAQGIALSPPARAYLRRANLGLKHFLARLPNEFRVEGPKGCERVIWCGAGSTVADMSAAVAFSVEAQAQQAHAQASAGAHAPALGPPRHAPHLTTAPA